MATISNLSRSQYVTNPKLRTRGNKLIAYKKKEAVRHVDIHRQKTHSVTPAPATNVIATGGNFSVILENNSMRVLKSLVFRFKITSVTAIKPVPVQLWWDRIECYIRNNQKEVIRHYGDNLYWDSQIVSGSKLKYWEELCSWDRTQTHPASTTKYYYLPLVPYWFDDMCLDMSSLKDEIEFKFYSNSAGLDADGAVDYTIDQIDIITEEEVPTRSSEADKKAFLMRHVPCEQYLAPQRTEVIAQTMNASTGYDFDLDSFQHKSAFLLVAIRPEATYQTNASYGNQGYQSLDDGSIDVLGSGGESLYGGGSPVDARYAKDIIASKHWHNDFFKTQNVYPVVFCNSVPRAYNGEVDGWLTLDSTRKLLRITTPSASVSEVQTVTQSGTPDAGTFQVSYRGDSTNAIAFDATVATIQSAIEALPSVASIGNVAVTVSAQADAGTTYTITLTKNGQGFDLGGHLFSINSNLTASSVAVSAPVTRTTVGNNGWVNGSYRVSIYSYYYRCAMLSGGRITIKDIN